MKNLKTAGILAVLVFAVLVLCGCEAGKAGDAGGDDRSGQGVHSGQDAHGSDLPYAADLIANGMPLDETSWSCGLYLQLCKAAAGDDSDADDVDVVIEATLERDGDISHVNGLTRIDISGRTSDVSMESWSVNDGSTVTTYTLTDNGWERTQFDAAGAGDMTSVINLDPAHFSDLSVTSDGDTYEVTGKAPLDALDALGVNELAYAMSDGTSDGIVMDCRMTYDKETRVLRLMTFEADDDAFDIFTVTLGVRNVGGTPLSIPAEVAG